MAQHHVHACTFYDDGDLEMECTCGTRGVLLVDDDTPHGMLLLALEDVDRPVQVTLAAPRSLAVSA